MIVSVLLVDYDDARGYPGTVKQVRWQTNNSGDVLTCQDLLANRLFSVASEQDAVRHDDGGLAIFGQRLQHVQEPRPVAVLFGRYPIPIEPVENIVLRRNPVGPRLIRERWVHHDKVELAQLTVFVKVLGRRQRRVRFNLTGALLMKHQVHLR